jgi:glycosyltransferase involved in cell wall biosynthesis
MTKRKVAALISFARNDNITLLNKLSLSICVPVYKGSDTLKRALESVFRQNYQEDFEVVILDDNQQDDTEEINKTKKIIEGFKSDRIRYFKNERNLGSALTIQKLAKLAKNEILIYLCQDDLFSRDSLRQIAECYLDEHVGVTTRPFFWFEDQIDKPVRAIYPPSVKEDLKISILNASSAQIISIFNSLGQISGLSYRKKYLSRDFTDDVFPGHIYPFAEIFKNYSCVFLKDYIVATSLKTSQTRYNSKIYQESPLQAWVKMFNEVYGMPVGNAYMRSLQNRFVDIGHVGIQNISSQYEGLVQIKNYGSLISLLREICFYIKYNPGSLLCFKFWFYVLMTIFIPRKILIILSDSYKRIFLARLLTKFQFDY